MQGARSYCLDADSNQSYVNGTKVQVWSCLNGTNQKWHSWPAG
jgi:hypothetical protein